MSEATIDQFFTKSPHTIGHHQTLAAARSVMQEFRIRHLPVLDGGKLVGILSERDLNFVEALKDVDSEEVAVAEAMSQEVFTVDPYATLRSVAKQMAEHRYGCAIVVDKAKVVGVFTTVDALTVLSSLLEARETDHW